MRVTIEHARKPAGLTGIDQASFSSSLQCRGSGEEDKAIIKARWSSTITGFACRPLRAVGPFNAAFVGSGLLRPIGAFSSSSGAVIPRLVTRSFQNQR